MGARAGPRGLGPSLGKFRPHWAETKDGPVEETPTQHLEEGMNSGTECLSSNPRPPTQELCDLRVCIPKQGDLLGGQVRYHSSCGQQTEIMPQPQNTSRPFCLTSLPRSGPAGASLLVVQDGLSQISGACPTAPVCTPTECAPPPCPPLTPTLSGQQGPCPRSLMLPGAQQGARFRGDLLKVSQVDEASRTQLEARGGVQAAATQSQREVLPPETLPQDLGVHNLSPGKKMEYM